jgi:hypothetical protein
VCAQQLDAGRLDDDIDGRAGRLLSEQLLPRMFLPGQFNTKQFHPKQLLAV